jgi:succinate dehydrogenase / fumarate reductase flavoprotein subunit
VEEIVQRALEPLERRSSPEGGESPYAVQQALQETMQGKVGIVRNEARMREAIEEIERLKRRSERLVVEGNREYNAGWHTAIDLGNLLTVAEAIARAGLARRENRGAHYREDMPGKSEAEGREHIVIRKGGDGSMEVSRDPIPPMRDDLRRIVEEVG